MEWCSPVSDSEWRGERFLHGLLFEVWLVGRAEWVRRRTAALAEANMVCGEVQVVWMSHGALRDSVEKEKYTGAEEPCV